MIIELDADLIDRVTEVTHKVPGYFSPAYDKRTVSRTMGFLGEAAASIFLTGSDEAFLETWRQMVDQPDKPDLDRFPDIEIKTVPDIKSPHFAIGNGFTKTVKETNYLVFRKIRIDRIKVEGWLPAEEIQIAYDSSTGRRFPSGTPILPTWMLHPSESCPWRHADAS